jgi:CBS domain-containing protein
MRVRDLMTKEVVSITPETTLRDAAALLAEHEISGLPVVNDAVEVVGVLSEADIVLKAGGKAGRSRLLGWLLESDLDTHKIEAETVGDAMSAPPVTISSKRPVHEAARVMATRGINRLPVVDDGELVGIITRADVVRAFSRSDKEIADEIHTEILQRTFWLEPGRVTVTVVDGHVGLTGEVETEADVELLPSFVSRVPGVVSVEADLRSRITVA